MDEFFLDLGAQALYRALREMRIEGDALHFDIVPGPTMMRSDAARSTLCWLTGKLSKG